MKRITAILLVCGVLCVSIIGCGKPDTLPSAGDGNIQDLGEDYVYDYQVSMEPIPKEIADLGGPCQGTIHAFPSKIQMGFTQKMMEEDPELKAEVEKRVPEIEQYLKENIGGEFRVNGVVIVDDVEWEFFCTEISSEYDFWLRYDNKQYFYRNEPYLAVIDNKIYLDDYYELQNTESQKIKYNQLISKTFDNCCSIAWISGISTELVTIRIAQFADNEIDKAEEQLKLLNLWADLKEYNSDALYNICVTYYPTSYKEIMETKFEIGYLWDIGRTKEATKKLMQNGEVIAELWYDDLTERKRDMGWDELLKEYQEEKYNKDAIWSYWM